MIMKYKYSRVFPALFNLSKIRSLYKNNGEEKRYVFQMMQWPEKETCRQDINSHSFQSQLLRAYTYVKKKKKKNVRYLHFTSRAEQEQGEYKKLLKS